MKKITLATMLILFSFVSLASAQSADEAYISQILIQVQKAAGLNIDNSPESQKKPFNAYCSLLAENINVQEVTSMVLGRRFSKKGQERNCRSGCVWDAANLKQKDDLVQAFHSVLAFKIDGHFTEKLKTQTITVGSSVLSRYKYSTNIAAVFSEGDEINFVVTQMDQPDSRDKRGSYLKNYFRNGPYKNYYESGHTTFLYDFEIMGIFVREFYQDTYKNLWNGLLGLTDSEKVDKVIEAMKEDSLFVSGAYHHCPKPVPFSNFSSTLD